ncbi:MAG: substrate-binding domain-containing protein [Chloroflexota bacterium]
MKPFTRIVIAAVLVVAAAAVGFRVYTTISDGDSVGNGNPDASGTPTPSPSEQPVTVSVVVALPIEPWASSAAEAYNEAERLIEGRPIEVEILPRDGQSAFQRWANGEFDPVPTAWLAESRAWVTQANTAALDRTRQDIFLEGGQYRAQPIGLSPLVWGIWSDAYQTLSREFETEDISWNEMHEAAVSDGWGALGGDEGRGRFKLVVAHPRRDPAGLSAMVSAAGAFYDKPSVQSDDFENPEFLTWLEEMLDTVVDFSPFGWENMLLYGRGNGDAGMMVESFLLREMEGLQQRWGPDPLEIVYPDPISWFDFPYAIYMGSETSAVEKEAALRFKEFLLSADQQAAALEFGLRPACPECPSDGGLIDRWEGAGVSQEIPAASRMRPASRAGLEFLTNWYVENYEE